MTKTAYVLEIPERLWDPYPKYTCHDKSWNTIDATEGSGVIFYNSEKAAQSANRGHFKGKGTVKAVKLTVEFI